MSIVFVDVYDLYFREWDPVAGRLCYLENPHNKRALRNKEDTYVIIFGPEQHNQKKLFLEQTTWTVLFQGIPARNKRAGYGYGGRNTIMIFEYNEPKA